MPNLSDFLKCEKVRCVVDDVTDLTKNAVYDVRNFSLKVKILDDVGDEYAYPVSCFEPVIETAIEASDKLDSTPMGTRTVNEFEVGDRVYYPRAGNKIFTLSEHEEKHKLHIDDTCYFTHKEQGQEPTFLICHATQENYELLCKLYPHIDFEKPPITGDELAMALLDSGKRRVYVKDEHGAEWVVYCYNKDEHGVRFAELQNGKVIRNVTPVDFVTGEILTSEVLDD